MCDSESTRCTLPLFTFVTLVMRETPYIGALNKSQIVDNIYFILMHVNVNVFIHDQTQCFRISLVIGYDYISDT